MIANFIIRVGASSPALEVQLTPDGAVPLTPPGAPPGGCAPKSAGIDLTGSRVGVELWKAGRVATQRVPAGIVTVVGDPVDGVVNYQWHPTDTAVAGLYYVTFLITFPDNTLLRWPFQREALSVEVAP